jgi:hypothetical protein
MDTFIPLVSLTFLQSLTFPKNRNTEGRHKGMGEKPRGYDRYREQASGVDRGHSLQQTVRETIP